MNKITFSDYFECRNPSVIRAAQIVFSQRKHKPVCVNTAIGNVSLKMHPAMQERMFNLAKSSEISISEGRVMYTATTGLEETQKAFLNVIASGGFDTKGLSVQITDGSSQGMEFVILGTSGEFDGKERPLLVFDPTYTNYFALTERTKRSHISVTRSLNKDGSFTLPSISEIQKIIARHNPSAMVVIPYDNPTGQYFDKKMMIDLAKLCVKNNMWMISDEAYRYMYYGNKPMVSIWGITDKEVPGIEGRRISLDSASKLFNGCGLRVGAIISDNEAFYFKALFEGTSNLSAPIIDQHIFGALADLNKKELQDWYHVQRDYYKPMMERFASDMEKLMPGIMVSSPDASIYSVIDVRNIASKNFDAMEFVLYSAREGEVLLNGEKYTLLTAPMAGFYSTKKGEENPGRTQLRIAFVESPEKMAIVPVLFKALLEKYEGYRNQY